MSFGQVEDLRAGQRARDGVDQSDDRLHDAAQKVDRRAQETAQRTDGAGLRRRIVLDDDVVPKPKDWMKSVAGDRVRFWNYRRMPLCLPTGALQARHLF